MGDGVVVVLEDDVVELGTYDVLVVVDVRVIADVACMARVRRARRRGDRSIVRRGVDNEASGSGCNDWPEGRGRGR